MILSAPKSTSSSKKENTVNGWFHSYAKFTLCDARSHPWSVKAFANSFAEITEFLTQIRIWQRQNYSCTSARISSRQQHRLSSPYPFHHDLLGWDSATMTEPPRNPPWGAEPGGEPWGAGEKMPPVFNPCQFSHLHRCGHAAKPKEQPGGRDKQLGHKGAPSAGDAVKVLGTEVRCTSCHCRQTQNGVTPALTR